MFFVLGGEHDATSTTTLELNARSEVVNECLLHIGRLHLELTRKVLDGESLSRRASNESGEVNVGLSSQEHSGSHLISFELFLRFVRNGCVAHEEEVWLGSMKE